MQFQLKDNIDTSKRLLQDIGEYCLRNQRAQAVIEADRAYHAAQLAKKQAEEREKTLEENDKQLAELLNELTNNESSITHDTDEMLKEVLENINTDNPYPDSQQFGQIDQYNNTHGDLQLSDSYQLIEGVEEDSSETDADMVIVKTTIKDYADKNDFSGSSSALIKNSSDSDKLVGTSQKELELEVLSCANSLIEKVVLNLKKLEVENVQIFHQNSSSLLFEPIESQLHPGKIENIKRKIYNESENVSTMSLYNFDDSNDLSASIELDNSQNMFDENKTTSTYFFSIY